MKSDGLPLKGRIAQFFLEIYGHNLMADHCSDKAIAFLGSHALLKKMS